MEGLQPEGTPLQVSRTKIPPEEEMEPRLLAEDSKVMYRPVASMVAEVVEPLACVPPVVAETSCVDGVQPEAPAQVSRTNALRTLFVPPETKFVAEDKNVT